jgi:hypothetical protein
VSGGHTPVAVGSHLHMSEPASFSSPIVPYAVRNLTCSRGLCHLVCHWHVMWLIFKTFTVCSPGCLRCFEPYTSNIYVRRVLSGEFTVVNQHLLHVSDNGGGATVCLIYL